MLILLIETCEREPSIIDLSFRHSFSCIHFVAVEKDPNLGRSQHRRPHFSYSLQDSLIETWVHEPTFIDLSIRRSEAAHAGSTENFLIFFIFYFLNP